MGIDVRSNKESAKFRPQEYFKNGNMCIDSAKYIKSRCDHIFINFQIYELGYLKHLRQGHKVHIFISSLLDSFYGNDKLFEFCEEAYKISGKYITIHIPYRSNKELRYSIISRLEGFNHYSIICNRLGVKFKFIEPSWKRTNDDDYIVVWHSSGTDNGYCVATSRPDEDK